MPYPMDSIEKLLSSPAAKLIQRKVNSTGGPSRNLNDNYSSKATERYSKLGFCYEFTKINESMIGIKLTHLRTGREYTQPFKRSVNSLQKDKLYFSRAMLRLMDASEGILPASSTSHESFDALRGASDFLFENMTSERKKCSPKEIVELINKQTSNHSPEFQSLDPAEIIEIWEVREKLSIAQQAELFSRIRLHLKIDENLRPINEYCYLPIIFDETFDSSRSKSIVDYIDNPETILRKENIDSTLLSSNLAPPLSSDEAKTGRSRTDSQTKETKETNNTKLTTSRTNDEQIKTLERKFSRMSVTALEDIWRNKESILDSAEEAAILLSFLRFEKGIDFHRTNYKNLINTEIIKKLDLPSIFEPSQKVTTNPKNTAQQQISYSDFTLDRSDKRQRTNSEISTRPGQAKFRTEVLSNYNACCITGCTVLTVIEAAHIAPYRGEKDNHIRNGVLLRTDIHRLFDANLIGISPDSQEIVISKHLKGTEYEKYAGSKIKSGLKAEPAKSALEYRWEYFRESNNIEEPE